MTSVEYKEQVKDRGIKHLYEKLNKLKRYGGKIWIINNDYKYIISYDTEECQYDIESYYKVDQYKYEYNCLEWVDERYEVVGYIYGGNKNVK